MKLEGLSSRKTNEEKVSSNWGKIPGFMADISKPIVIAAGLVMSPHGAEAVEIPEGSSYADGIELLRQGVLEDPVETSAYYIETADGHGIWVSYEGEVTGVGRTFEEISEYFSDAITSLEVSPGDVVTIKSFHTHPISAGVNLGLISVKEENPQISAPPSIGYEEKDY